MSEILLPLHILSLLFIAWNVLHADHMGLNWIRGKVSKLDKDIIEKYHYRTWAGLLMMIITGLALFWPMKDFLLTLPQFYIKMAFVFTIFCNSFAIGILSKTSTTKEYSSLSMKEKIPLMISGAVSVISWLGATGMGFLLEQE